jgi:hypothetical protein
LESTRILVAPGLRTLPRSGWRTGISTAWSVVSRKPNLWLLGALGLSLRGGIVLLTLPIIALPTQVEARLLLGDYLGTTGFTPSFWTLLGTTAVAAALLTVVVLLALARIELRSFERLIVSPDAQREGDLRTAELPPAARRTVFIKLFAVQVLSFIALISCVAPVAWLTVSSAFTEITRPTSLVPIYERVLSAVAQPLFFLLLAIVILEMLSSLASREVMARAFGGNRVRRSRSWHAPARVLGTALVGWIATFIALAPAMWALGLAYGAVRGVFLSAVSLSDFGDDLGMAAAALALSAAFTLALFLGGFASSYRAALWSLTRLR